MLEAVYPSRIMETDIPPITNLATARLELLAPARDAACGRVAVDCGADAVYIGAPQFGARAAAANRLEEIAELIEYAHRYWVRVYVALNTLLRDEEISPALVAIRQLHAAGADALIIQDMGLLELATSGELPPIALHASTQCNITSAAKVQFLAQAGCRRVVLARELSLPQIAAIHAATPAVELESFVHGALCVCYSGQCYLSQSIGGRSGNRGECAQPCRKFYTLEDAGHRTLAQGHLLSLKDMNRAEHLPDLIGAGISSFKIEGRLKDAAYVANVVGHYRLALDAAMAGLNTEAGEIRFCAGAAGKTELGFTPDPTKTFNRGYTPYFLHGRPESREPLLGEPRSPKMIGEVIGAVEGVQGEWVALNSALAHPPTLRNGDGVCWFDGEGILLGALINAVAPLTHGQRVRLGNVTPPPVGTALYRNHDHAFLNQLDPAPARRRIAMTMRLLQAEGALRLEARDADGCMAEVLHEGEIRMAERAETMRATWERQLAKTGETEFTCERVELPEADMPFLPISTINQLRREVLDALRTARLRNRPLLKPGVAAADHPYPERELTFEGNVLNHFAANFYRRHGVGTIEPAAESGRVNLHGKRVMQTRHCLRRQLGECPHDTVEAHHTRHLPSPATPLWLVDAEGHRVRLKFNCADCLSATAEAPVAMELRLE